MVLVKWACSSCKGHNVDGIADQVSRQQIRWIVEEPCMYNIKQNACPILLSTEEIKWECGNQGRYHLLMHHSLIPSFAVLVRCTYMIYMRGLGHLTARQE